MAVDNDPETYAVIGAALEVHNVLGCGFLEAVYHEAFARELHHRGIAYRRQVHCTIDYKGKRLPLHYIVDFICFASVIVEVKAIPDIAGRDYAQLRNYLRMANYQKGLLLNFGTTSLQFRLVTPAAPERRGRIRNPPSP